MGRDHLNYGLLFAVPLARLYEAKGDIVQLEHVKHKRPSPYWKNTKQK